MNLPIIFIMRYVLDRLPGSSTEKSQNKKSLSSRDNIELAIFRNTLAHNCNCEILGNLHLPTYNLIWYKATTLTKSYSHEVISFKLSFFLSQDKDNLLVRIDYLTTLKIKDLSMVPCNISQEAFLHDAGCKVTVCQSQRKQEILKNETLLWSKARMWFW